MSENEFTQLVKQYNKLIFTVCLRFINNYHDAENITQETFLTAYKVIENFVGDNYKGWLVKIATNKCKDYLKSSYVSTTSVVETQEFNQIENGELIHKQFEEKECIDKVQDACRSLKEPYAKVAILHFIEDKSFDEISKELDIPLKTVQTQTYRARDKLRSILKEELFNV